LILSRRDGGETDRRANDLWGATVVSRRYPLINNREIFYLGVCGEIVVSGEYA
jgi:hypothetical protein